MFRALPLLVVVAAALPAQPSPQPLPQPRWIATWAPSVYAAAPRPTNPDSTDRVATYVDRTLREVVRTTVGGSRVRVRLTNEYGDRPLVVGAVRVAVRDSGARVRAGTERAITFGGKPGVVLRAGASVVSDGVAFDVPPLADLAISLYLPDTSRASSMHGAAYQTSYVSSAGDQTAAAPFPVERTITQWQFLAGVDVVNARASGAVVAIGNSITDGAGSTRDANARWPDGLARRLLASGAPGAPIAVVNAGIGGNRILSPTTGPSALARFERDVLGQPGVTHVIVTEGINDLLRGTNPPDPRDEISADDLIFGLRQLVDRARERGLVVIGGTLTPIGGLARGGPAAQAKVDAVNAWIRTSGAYDGVIDFYKATGDPAQPDRFLPAYDSGDHLHPSDAGYRAMADAIDLALFRPRKRR
ncbi:MAG: SGNH/GDSL hydrolase family protein [Gemmatirosa sp.]|nr:SGNH/GDSL hydrolase family protein [Gemmatirosa sp.]